MSQATETTARPDAPRETESLASLSLSYHELRSLAEYASSIRGRDVYFVRGETGWEAHDSVDHLPPSADPIHVYNPASPERPQVSQARIWAVRHGTEVEADLMKLTDPVTGDSVEADAVFWSVSAVEKFLVPYYASVYGDRADVEVAQLLDVLDSPRDEGADPAAVENGDAFALAHIPRSEYVTVGGATVLVLAHGPRSHVRVLTLEQHARERQEAKSARKSGSRST